MRKGHTRALAAGVGVAALYAASAVLSGHLSPLARRPLLDGLPPPIPYRWVEPPPELAATNLVPATERFVIRLGDGGTVSNVITTADAQVSLILPEGIFARADGQRSVEVTIEPLAASGVEPAEEPNRIVGNVYRLSAMYRPSGDPAALSGEGEARVVLIYPLTTGDHGTHGVLVSADGRRWEEVDSTDFTGIQQVDGPIAALGSVAVGSNSSLVTSSPTAPPLEEGGGSPAATIVIGACVVLLAGAAAFLVFGGRSSRRPRGSARGSRPGSRSRYR